MKEALIQRQITDFLSARQRFWIRLNTGSFPDREGKRWVRSHSLGRGTADILLPASGSIWVECKNETGRQSQFQKDFQLRVEELGHLYVVARSFLDVEELL